MLTFESPFYEIEGVVIFRDHASPSTFHYLAGPPHLTVSDGVPNLLLLKYKNALDAMGAGAAPARDQLGGAFLLFGVDCGLPEATKNTIKSKLQSFLPPTAGAVSLVPVLYTKGKVNVIALDQQTGAATADSAQNAEKSKFVRGILGTAVPSLLQDQRAIFSLSLTPDAATLIEQAYESDLSPIGVMYELDFAGLRPALSVSAQVDMKRVYESLKLGLHAGVQTGGDGQPGSGTQSGAGGQIGSGGQSSSGQTSATGTATAPASPASPPRTAPAPVNATPPATPPAAPSGAGVSAASGAAAAPAAAPAAPASGSSAAAASASAPSAQPAAPRTAADTQPAGGTGPSPQNKGTSVYLSADIGFTLEKLKQEQAIKIEIIRQQEGASVDQMEKNAMDLLKQTVIDQFFQPAMTTQPAAPTAALANAASTASQLMATSRDTNTGQSGKTKVEIGFQLQYKHEEELKSVTFDYSVIAPETRTHAPNGFFSAILSKTDKAKHIRQIDLDDPFFKVLSVDVTSAADFEALDLQAVNVSLQYGGSVAQPKIVGNATFTVAKKDAQRFQAFLQQNEYFYRYMVSYIFGQAERVSAQKFKIDTPWRSTTSRALVINPPEDVPLLHLYVEPGVVDWDVVSQIETTVTYDDPDNHFHAERTFQVKSDSKRQEWIIRLSNPQQNAYQVRNRWHLKDMSQIQGKSERRADPQLFVSDPFADRLPITVDPHVDPANIARVNVELQYEDSANNFSVRKEVELEAPFKRTTVTIPVVDSKKREYTYSVSLVKPNGQAETHAPKETDQLSIIITEGGVYLDVDVVLVGDLATLNVDALEVDLQSEPLDGAQKKIESHLFLPGEAKRFTQRLLLRADRPTEYQYRTKVLTADREIEGNWTKAQSKILLLQVQRLLQG